MIRRRKKTQRFTQINNEPLRNPSMSLKAKGLLALMMSVPENWVFHVGWLIKQSKDGRDATRAALKELEEHRYVIRRKVMSAPPKTQFVGWEWLVDDTPILDIDPDSVVVLEPGDETENPNEDDAPKPGPKVKESDDSEESPDLLETRLSGDGEGISRQTGFPSVGNADVGKSATTNTESFKEKEREEEERGEAPTASTASPSPETSSSLEASPEELLEALLDQAEGGQQAEGQIDQPEDHQAPSLPNHSDSADVLATDQKSELTAGEKVPGGAAAPADPVEMERAVNREIDTLLTNRWLRPYGHGDDKKPPLISERPKGIDRKRVAKLLTLDTLDELVRAAQADEPPFATALLRRLDAVVSEYRPTAPSETAGDLTLSGPRTLQVGDEVVYRHEPYEVVKVTERVVTLALLSDKDITTGVPVADINKNTFRPYRRQQVG